MADERPFASPAAGPTHASRRWRAMPRWERRGAIPPGQEKPKSASGLDR